MNNEKSEIILEKLEQLLEEGKQSAFSEDEAKLLKNIAKFFLAMTVLGPPGRVLLKMLGYGAAMVITYASFKAGLGDIIKDLLNG